MQRLAILTALALAAPAVAVEPPVPVHAPHNPILSDGEYYSTDPAPIVVGDTLYILTGRDEAPPDVDDFIMNEWQVLATKDPASGDWLHYRHFLRPEQVFAWAAPGRAYAGQIVEGPDSHGSVGRFYLYAPVLEANSKNADGFAIGVAVSDSPLGPWTDAHPSGPVVSQSTPEPNTIQNIDPTPFVDDDGRVYLYWGTFGKLRGMELAADMVTPKSAEMPITGLTGFFEAAWLFKRKGTYYLAYAGNKAGPDSDCTPAIYYACIAYGTAPSPMGPWTYRGVILKPVSSTTSHPGIVQFKGTWYIAYHTADAKGGGHFRRSVAIDQLHWDDSISPAAILPVTPTPVRPAVIGPQRNMAPAARAMASNQPIPVQYWLGALNDGIVRANPLPPDMWSNWTGQSQPASQWIAYQWDKPIRIDGVRIHFWNDQPAGSGEGVAPPKAWHVEYWTKSGWQPVKARGAYGTAADRFNDVDFAPVTTRCLRAVLEASSDGKTYAALAVQEWEALAPAKRMVRLLAPGEAQPVPATGACLPGR